MCQGNRSLPMLSMTTWCVRAIEAYQGCRLRSVQAHSAGSVHSSHHRRSQHCMTCSLRSGDGLSFHQEELLPGKKYITTQKKMQRHIDRQTCYTHRWRQTQQNHQSVKTKKKKNEDKHRRTFSSLKKKEWTVLWWVFQKNYCMKQKKIRGITWDIIYKL